MSSFTREIIRLAIPEYIPAGLFGVAAGAAVSAMALTLNYQFILALISVTFVIAGYNSYNAIFDIEMDRINKPNRPLPKHTIEIKHAHIAAMLFFIISILIAYTINSIFLVVILVSVLLAVLYSFPQIHLKKRIVAGTVLPTVLYTVLFPLAGWAILSSNPIPVFLIIYLFIFGISTAAIKDFEDMEGDRLHGAHTPVVHLGYNGALYLISILFIVSAAFLVFLIIYGGLPFANIIAAALTIPALANVLSLHWNRTKAAGSRAFRIGLLILILVEAVIIAVSIIA